MLPSFRESLGEFLQATGSPPCRRCHAIPIIPVLGRGRCPEGVTDRGIDSASARLNAYLCSKCSSRLAHTPIINTVTAASSAFIA
jgi:hypothetical protein